MRSLFVIVHDTRPWVGSGAAQGPVEVGPPETQWATAAVVAPGAVRRERERAPVRKNGMTEAAEKPDLSNNILAY